MRQAGNAAMSRGRFETGQASGPVAVRKTPPARQDLPHHRGAKELAAKRRARASRRFGWGTVVGCCAFAHVATALATGLAYKEFSLNSDTASLPTHWEDLAPGEIQSGQGWALLPGETAGYAVDTAPEAPAARQAPSGAPQAPQVQAEFDFAHGSIFDLEPTDGRDVVLSPSGQRLALTGTPERPDLSRPVLSRGVAPQGLPAMRPTLVEDQDLAAADTGTDGEDPGEGYEDESVFGMAVPSGADILEPMQTVSLPIAARPGAAVLSRDIIERDETGFSVPLPLIPGSGESLTIAAVGDIMIGSNVRRTGSPSRPVALNRDIAAILQQSDIAVGNLEGNISDAPLSARSCGGSNCYRFLMPGKAADVLADAGFDFMALANNHANDFGSAGHSHTRSHLDRAGIAYAGHRQGGPALAIREVRGRKVGFLSFGTSSCCYDIRRLEESMALVSDSAGKTDILIVAFHGGAEGRSKTRLPKSREIFLGMDRGDVHAFSRRAVDHGADLVIGSGPHVPRAAEVYRGRLIAYSLGNFWTPRDVSLSGPAGLAPLLQAELAPDGRVLDHRVISAVQQKGGSPRPDRDMRAARLIDDLTRMDFPRGDMPSVLARAE